MQKKPRDMKIPGLFCTGASSCPDAFRGQEDALSELLLFPALQLPPGLTSRVRSRRRCRWETDPLEIRGSPQASARRPGLRKDPEPSGEPAPAGVLPLSEEPALSGPGSPAGVPERAGALSPAEVPEQAGALSPGLPERSGLPGRCALPRSPRQSQGSLPPGAGTGPDPGQSQALAGSPEPVSSPGLVRSPAPGRRGRLGGPPRKLREPLPELPAAPPWPKIRLRHSLQKGPLPPGQLPRRRWFPPDYSTAPASRPRSLHRWFWRLTPEGSHSRENHWSGRFSPRSCLSSWHRACRFRR